MTRPTHTSNNYLSPDQRYEMKGNEWCFRPRFCTVRLYWAGDNHQRYECALCGKKFIDLIFIEKHVKNVHGDKIHGNNVMYNVTSNGVNVTPYCDPLTVMDLHTNKVAR